MSESRTEDKPTDSEGVDVTHSGRASWQARSLSLLLLAVVCLLLEGGLRYLLPMPEVRHFNRIDYTSTIVNPSFAEGSYLRNVSYTWSNALDGVAFTHDLNLYGFRDRQWKVAKDRRRVMIVGDSFVEGMMAGIEEHIPAGFLDAAQQGGEVLEVMNLGVGAAGPNEYVSLVRDSAPIFEPDDVIVVMFANDIPCAPLSSGAIEDSSEVERYSSWKPRLLHAFDSIRSKKRVVFRGSRPSFSYFRPVPDPSNPWTEYEDAFSAFVDQDIADAMKAGEFNPFVADELNFIAAQLKVPFDVEPHVRALRDLSKQWNFNLYVLYIPYRHQVSGYYAQFAERFSRPTGSIDLTDSEFQMHAREVERACASVGIAFLDMTTAIRAEEESGRHLYWDYDAHMRGAGYTFVGRTMHEWWASFSDD